MGDEREWTGAQTAGFVVGFMVVCALLAGLLMAAMKTARDERLAVEGLDGSRASVPSQGNGDLYG